MNECRGRIISALKYESKKTGNPGMRLDYFFETEDSFYNKENFVGFVPQDYFSDDISLFEKAKNLIMRPVNIVYVLEPSKSNPLKSRAVIKDACSFMLTAVRAVIRRMCSFIMLRAAPMESGWRKRFSGRSERSTTGTSLIVASTAL